MAVIGEAELKQQLKTGDYAGAYFIFGEESYLKEFYISKLKSKLVDEAFADFNLHQHEGKDSSIDDILMDASMLPMMSERSLVIAHDYPFDKTSDEEKLEEFLKDSPETSVLVFWYDSIEVDIKRVKKWGRISKLFEKYGCSVALEKRSEGELAKLVINSAKKRGCNIDRVCASYLISVVGNDIQTIFNELEKICSFVGEGDITKKEIDELAVKSLQARVYDLSKFILKGNGDGAYGVLTALFAQKEEVIKIFSVLASCYVDMYRVKCARQAGIPDSEIASVFGYKGREFLIRNAARDGSYMSIEALRLALDLLSEADEKLKSTGIDDKLVLEETVAKLLVMRNK